MFTEDMEWHSNIAIVGMTNIYFKDVHYFNGSNLRGPGGKILRKKCSCKWTENVCVCVFELSNRVIKRLLSHVTKYVVLMQRHIRLFMVLLLVCDFVVRRRKLQIHFSERPNFLSSLIVCSTLFFCPVMIFPIVVHSKGEHKTNVWRVWNEVACRTVFHSSSLFIENVFVNEHFRQPNNMIRSVLSVETENFITSHVPFDLKRFVVVCFIGQIRFFFSSSSEAQVNGKVFSLYQQTKSN